MNLKIIVSFLGLINGGWMIFDGFYVLVKGKYFGPDHPGPWSKIFVLVGIDPFKLGIPFIIFGFVWLLAIFGLVIGHSWAWHLTFLISILTLWYLPIGTLLSLVTISLLLIIKVKNGI